LPYILLGAALLALVIWLTVKARAGTKGLAPAGQAVAAARTGRLTRLTIADRQFLLNNEGVVCRLVGPDFPGIQANDVVLAEDSPPGVVLGTVALKGDRVVLTTEGEGLALVQGPDQSRQLELKPGEYRLKFTGRLSTDPDMPPIPFNTGFRVLIE
jgi:hypothetical protein